MLKRIKIISCCCAALSLAGCFPVIQNALINLASGIIILQSDWNFFLTVTGVVGLLISGAALFCASENFFECNFTKEKSPIFYFRANTVLICVFFIFATVLASLSGRIWNDEGFSVMAARLPYYELFTSSIDEHPNFYYIIVKFFSGIAGDGVFALKMLSVFPVLFTLICVSVFLNREFSPASACFFCLSFIAGNTMLYYAIEVRMYSWTMFFVAVSCICAYYIVRRGKFCWYAGFTLSAVLGALCEHYGAFIIGIEYLMLICYAIKYDRSKLKNILLIIPFALLLYFHRLFVTINQFIFFGIKSGTWIQSYNITNFVKNILYVFMGGNLILAVPFFLLFCAVLAFFIKAPKNKKKFFALCCLLCFFALWSVCVIFSFAFKPIMADRHLMPASVLVWVFFSVACGLIQNRRVVIFTSAVLIVLGLSNLSCSLYREYYEGKKYSSFYSYITRNFKHGDMLIFGTGGIGPFQTVHVLGEVPEALLGEGGKILEYEGPLARRQFREILSPETVFARSVVGGGWIFCGGSPGPGKEVLNGINRALDKSDARFCGDFYANADFKLYYTEDALAFLGGYKNDR